MPQEQAVAGDQGDARFAEILDGGPGGRRALARDADGLAGPWVINEDGHLAADAVILRLEDGKGQTGGHGRIDRVAADRGHAHAGCRGQIVAGSDHAAAAHHHGPGSKGAHRAPSAPCRC